MRSFMQNWLNRPDAVWVMGSDWPKESCVRCGSSGADRRCNGNHGNSGGPKNHVLAGAEIPMRRGNFREVGKVTAHCKVWGLFAVSCTTRTHQEMR